MSYLGPERRRSPRLSVRERILVAAAVVGLVMAGISGCGVKTANDRANRAVDRVAAESRARALESARQVDDTALASYRGCVDANEDLRPAARLVAVVLRDLVRAVNQSQGPLPAAFRNAPGRLNRAVARLAPRNCPRAYQDGYAVAVRRGLVKP